MKKKPLNTEEQIKVTAKKLFLEKGYEATTTRDIAQASGLNLALINYYYRSKQRLYEIIVRETVDAFLEQVNPVLNSTELDLNGKLVDMVDRYTDFMLNNPDIPLFLVTECHRDPKSLAQILPLDNIRSTRFYEEIKEKFGEKIGDQPYFAHLLVNCFSMIVGPVLLEPMAKEAIGMTREEFVSMMNMRKMMIPVWLGAMAQIAE